MKPSKSIYICHQLSKPSIKPSHNSVYVSVSDKCLLSTINTNTYFIKYQYSPDCGYLVKN